MASRTPEVALERMSQEKIQYFLDHPDMAKHAEKIISKLTSHHMSTIIGLQVPQFREDFPDIIPASLRYDNYRPMKQGQQKVKVKIEKTFEEETKEFLGEDMNDVKRRSRFSGTYNVNELEKAYLEVKKEPHTKRKRRKSNSSHSSGTSTSQLNLPNLKIMIQDINTNPKIKRENYSDDDCHETASTMQEALDHFEKLKLNLTSNQAAVPSSSTTWSLPATVSRNDQMKISKKKREEIAKILPSSSDEDEPKTSHSVKIKKKRSRPVITSSSSDLSPVRTNIDPVCKSPPLIVTEPNLDRAVKSLPNMPLITTDIEKPLKKRKVDPEILKSPLKIKEKVTVSVPSAPIKDSKSEKKVAKEYTAPPIIEPPQVCFRIFNQYCFFKLGFTFSFILKLKNL